MRIFVCCVALFTTLRLCAAERVFDFSQHPLNEQPSGFRSVVAGDGNPGTWKIILDEVPLTLAPLTSKAQTVNERPVLAQVARTAIDHHFPMLIFEEETYTDFKLTTRFKLVGGALEQMAGIVFRFQNESNFYVVRASGLGNTFRCYKVENGILRPPIGPEIEIPKNVWHELSLQCEGTRISCSLNGRELIKIVDNSLSGQAGKIGFWTKSDSVSHFVDTRIVYKAREPLAQALVRNALAKYPRVADLQVFATNAPEQLVVVASKHARDLGTAGNAAVANVLETGTHHFSRDRETVSVILPLRDRNGDPIAAVRVQLMSFPGQTEQNALARALPILKQMQSQVQSAQDLLN
jgi:hypothetical protein